MKDDARHAEGACAVTYRGTLAGGGEAEIELLASSEAATLAEAWSQLCARFGDVDPRSIEIEVRELHVAG